jgi:Uma2 family endonuclease
MTASPHSSLMSVEEYLQLDRTSPEARYEYVDGYARKLVRGTPDHAKISTNIVGVLYSLLDDTPYSLYTSDVRVCLSPTRYVYPDVSVIADGQHQGPADSIQHPRLVVEVLTAQSEVYDRGRKLAYYRECPTIQEYMLVNSQHPSIEVYRSEKDTLWRYHAFGTGDTVMLTSLDILFPLAKVYRNVVLPEEDDFS